MNTKQKGSIELIIIGVLVVVLIGVISYMFWKNYSSQEKTVTNQTRRDTEAKPVKEARRTDQQDQPGIETGAYVDLRKEAKYNSGTKITTASDIDKLTEAGPELRQYFTENVGKPVEVMFAPEKQPQVFIVDQVYGNYARGSTNAVNAAVVWGPRDQKISVITGSQNAGFNCDDLKLAKVPPVLVDYKCIDGKNIGTIPYN